MSLPSDFRDMVAEQQEMTKILLASERVHKTLKRMFWTPGQDQHYLVTVAVERNDPTLTPHDTLDAAISHYDFI